MDKLDDVNQPERNSRNSQEIEDEPLHDVQNWNTGTQDIPEFDNATQFNDFMKNFQLKCSNKEWERRNPNYVFNEISQEDILNSTNYKLIQNNPLRNKSRVILRGIRAFNNDDYVTAVLYFDEAIRKGVTRSIRLWSTFSDALMMVNQFDRAIGAIKELLYLKPEDLDRHSLLCSLYIKYKCKYQICQSAFNWLKNNQMYSHLIPPHFTMDNKNSSELDNNQFNSVEEFFLKASELNSINPDLDLNNMLRSLYFVYGDFERVVDCMRTTVIFSETDLPVQISRLGYCLLHSEEPYEALDTFRTLTIIAKRNAYLGLGFVHMYLKNYRLAIRYYKKAICPRSLVREFQIEGNTLKAEFDLCLRLYWQCVK